MPFGLRHCAPQTKRRHRPLTPLFSRRALRPLERGRVTRRQDRLPHCPVKGSSSDDPRRLPSTSCPLGPPPLSERRTSNASTATGVRTSPPWTRLPTLFRHPAPRRGRLDRGRYRVLIAPGRTWPRAARRLLQSKRSASTTGGPRNPTRLEAARLSSSSSPTEPVRIRWGRRRFPDDDSVDAEPRSHGSGAVVAMGFASFDVPTESAPFDASMRPPPRRWLAARASPQPDRLEHPMSRHPARLR